MQYPPSHPELCSRLQICPSLADDKRDYLHALSDMPMWTSRPQHADVELEMTGNGHQTLHYYRVRRDCVRNSGRNAGDVRRRKSGEESDDLHFPATLSFYHQHVIISPHIIRTSRKCCSLPCGRRASARRSTQQSRRRASSASAETSRPFNAAVHSSSNGLC